MKAINVNYPIQKGLNGFFEQTFNTTDAVKSKIRILFYTMEGERPFNPDFGLGLHRYLFDQMTPQLYSTIQSKILTKLNRYVPEIEVISLEINKDSSINVDRNELIINLTFSLKTNPDKIDEINIIIE